MIAWAIALLASLLLFLRGAISTLLIILSFRIQHFSQKIRCVSLLLEFFLMFGYFVKFRFCRSVEFSTKPERTVIGNLQLYFIPSLNFFGFDSKSRTQTNPRQNGRDLSFIANQFAAVSELFSISVVSVSVASSVSVATVSVVSTSVASSTSVVPASAASS